MCDASHRHLCNLSLIHILLNLVAVYRKNSQKEVNVSLDYQRTSDLMMGDRDQLLNVVSNLLENSVKYSGCLLYTSL